MSECTALSTVAGLCLLAMAAVFCCRKERCERLTQSNSYLVFRQCISKKQLEITNDLCEGTR